MAGEDPDRLWRSILEGAVELRLRRPFNCGAGALFAVAVGAIGYRLLPAPYGEILVAAATATAIAAFIALGVGFFRSRH